MFIVCPHCTTSYAIDLATLGASGRTVRCSRCKEVWLAHPEDAVEAPAPIPAMAEDSHSGGLPDETDWETLARSDADDHPPIVASPSIAADWPEESAAAGTDWPTTEADAETENDGRRRPWFRRVLKKPSFAETGGKPGFNLPALTLAMGALVIALVVWRADVVRLMPQTAAFYRLVGLDVNLRGAIFKDLKVVTETVDGKPVLVIEGAVVATGRKPVDLPRLRFSVRDAQGAEIYAWNAVLDQTRLKPGERAAFKSRLASPPPEGRNIDIRFFNRRDITAGNA
ncbi:MULTISPECIES: MJ0042-type zinc finger domain-containing protein [unclassified Bradyrhizobium]|uniref:MJ0042-type zinc finger domain-containing protein n=1 Tax=unclassified Bradyrhizobium TaxID=2631580 RepID=UPI0028E88EA0|nr:MULTISPECIES: MJ0042-type zinc finger domain-containing protein [unclassified Bradyrhizobium]